MNTYVYEAVGDIVPQRTQCKYRRDGEFSLAMNYIYGPMIFSLNQTSTEILDMCDGTNKIRDIFEALMHKYSEVSPEIIKRMP